MVNQNETPKKQGNMFLGTSDSKLCKKLTNSIVVIGLLTLTCIVYYYNTKDIELKLAWGGSSPQNYVAEKLYPENFRKNWEAAGVGKYDFSLPMKVYYYLAKYFDINPTSTMYPYMFIQTLLFLFSVAFLTQTLFQNKFITFLSVVIISVSNLAGLNLSRFGTGYGSALSWPLFYGYANAFRFFALSFFLRNKYILCFVFLALSIYCHVNMGLFALAFIGAYFLIKPQLFRDKSVLVGISVFLVPVIPHIYSIISNASISSGGIPVDQWVKSTRIFSFHWYPITMKMFTINAHREFLPFLLLSFFFFMALRYQDIKNEKNSKIIIGSIACLTMGMVGVVFSDVYPIPFLIKMSLQRSTGLITFFGVLYVIYYLCKKIESANIIFVFLGVYSLLVLVFSKPGIAVLPLFLLLFSDIREGHVSSIKIHSDKIKGVKGSYYIVALLLLLVTLVCIFEDKVQIAHNIFVHLWSPLKYFDPFYGFDFLVRGGGFKVYPIFMYLIILSVLITGSIIAIKKIGNKILTLVFICIFCVGSISIAWSLEWVKYQRWHKRYAKVASAYLDVQLWAKKNTPTDALFMPDPSHSYGWRDFSERSSFGNLREWGYTAIAYNPDAKIYREGIKRMREFGINVEEVTDGDLREWNTGVYGPKLIRDVRKSFYTMSADKLKALWDKYRINYMVMNRKYHKPVQQADLLKKFRIAYMNDHFIVYSSGKQEYDFQSSFSNWKGPDTINMRDLSRTAPPLILQGVRGVFNFTRISDNGGHVIKVSPFRKSKEGELTVQFGYTLNKNGFDFKLDPGQKVILAVSARLSDKTKKPTTLFIQDKSARWERNSVRINKSSWDQYIVSKKIRAGVTNVGLGIVWCPENENEWLEIKDVRVFIVDDPNPKHY